MSAGNRLPPAPWRVVASGGDWSASHDGIGHSAYEGIEDADGVVIALAVEHDRTLFKELKLEHSALIAAAPELLSELQMAHRLLMLALKHMGGERQSLFAAESEREGLGTDGATRYHERAAVIAKATGASA